MVTGSDVGNLDYTKSDGGNMADKVFDFISKGRQTTRPYDVNKTFF